MVQKSACYLEPLGRLIRCGPCGVLAPVTVRGGWKMIDLIGSNVFAISFYWGSDYARPSVDLH